MIDAANAASAGVRNRARREFPLRGLAVTGLVLLVIGILGFLSVGRLRSRAWWIVNDTLPELSEGGFATSSVAEELNRVLLALTAGDPADRARFIAESGEFTTKTAALLEAYEKGIYLDEDRANFSQLIERRGIYLNVRQSVLKFLEHNRRSEALEACKHALIPAYTAYKAQADVLLDYNTRQARVRGGDFLQACTETRYLVASIAIFLFVAGFLIGVFR